jgi:hypothetical protein
MDKHICDDSVSTSRIMFAQESALCLMSRLKIKRRVSCGNSLWIRLVITSINSKWVVRICHAASLSVAKGTLYYTNRCVGGGGEGAVIIRMYKVTQEDVSV